jgi:Carboxypeptidase regulatory-like domain/TonB dependent receptor-like, beta-barrel
MDTKTPHMKAIFGYLVCCSVCLFSFVGNLHAQGLTGSIIGRVSDQSGAVIQGARVVATNNNTGYNRESTTNQDGFYSLPALPYGVYSLEASANGFKTLKQGPMTLNSTQQLSIDLLLTPGAVAETVEVKGIGQTIQTQEAATKAQVYLDQVQNLPLNSRSPFELGLLGPSIQTNHQQSGPAVQYTINGQNVNGYKLMFDGMEAGIGGDAQYYAGNNFNLSITSVDAIQEFDLQTGNYAADTKGSSGYVNIVSRTGTNQLHGDVYDFFRNGALDANNYFAVKKGSLKQNDFGGTVTGPIVKNKIFFMGSYEGQRIHLPYPAVANVPTAAFRATVDPRLNPLLDLTPLPTQSIPGNPDIGIFAQNVLAVINQNLVTGRVDINASQKDRVFVAYTWNGGRLHGAVVTTGNGPAIFPGTSNSQPETHQNAVVGWNHVFSPTFLNDFNIGLNRFLQERAIGPDDATAFYTLPRATVPGLTIQGGGNTKKLGNTQPQLTDKAIWVKGKSTLSFGGNYLYLMTGQNQFNYIGMSFPTLAAFAADAPSSLSATFGVTGREFPEHLHWNQVGLFVQEDYRATPSLTLNIGLRYDNFGVFKNSQPYALNIIRYPFDPYRPQGRALYNSNHDFGPRFGFAWQPRSGSVVRGGFGLFYGTHVSGQMGDVLALNSVHPFSVTTSDFPDLSYPFDPALFQFVNANALGRFVLDPHSKDLYSEQWNLTFEHQFGHQTLFTLGYVGNHGVHVPGTLLPNNFDPIIGSRTDPNFGTIREVINSFNSHYHGLQAQVRRRLSNNLAFDGSYAWGHTTGLSSGILDVSAAVSFSNDQIQAYGAPPYNVMKRSHGNLSTDVRHSFSGDFVYQLPRLDGANGFVKSVFGGWTTSGIIQASTGQPFNVTTGGDTGDNNFHQFPNRVPGVPLYLSGRNPAQGFLNPAAFSIPTAVDPSSGLVLGNLAINTIRMPVNFTFNYMLGKRLGSAERFNFDFRAEFFNILNHPIFGLPTTNLAAGSLFGTSTTATDPREIQFMLKVSF